MSEKETPHGFKLEIGSTVTILTTAATEVKALPRKKHKEEDCKDFNDDKEFKDHKDLKEHKDYKNHKEYKEHKDYEGHKDCDAHKDYEEHKDCEPHKDCEEHKDCEPHKEFGDNRGIFTGIVLDETDFKLNRDENWEHSEKGKEHPPVDVDREEEFLILSLLKPSAPFAAGQIISINLDQIVALSVICAP